MTATPTKLALLALCLIACNLQPALAEDVDWRADYNVARKEAAEKGLPIVLDFGFEGCQYCRKLDAVTFRDTEVIKRLNGKFVPLRIDIQKDPSLAEKLGLQMYPTVVFASPEGHILGKVEGYQEPGRFQENLDRVLDLVANPEWMKRDYESAGKAIGSSDYARAIALLKNVVQDGKDRPVQVKARRYPLVIQRSTGFSHPRNPLGNSKLIRTGATRMENTSAPKSAKATVQAIGRKIRPSTFSSVKIGRYAVMMMVMA